MNAFWVLAIQGASPGNHAIVPYQTPECNGFSFLEIMGISNDLILFPNGGRFDSISG